MNRVVVVTFFFLSISLKGLCIDALELFSGWLEADLRAKQDYEGVPVFVSFDFNIKSAFDKINWKIKGNTDFIVEPFSTLILSPDTNVEVGVNFLLKYIYPLSPKIKPYFKGGVGILYMSQHTQEQSTQYNFLPQVSIGLHYFLNKKTALSWEYRYRHLSNASTGHPNKGIDGNLILGGISFFF